MINTSELIKCARINLSAMFDATNEAQVIAFYSRTQLLLHLIKESSKSQREWASKQLIELEKAYKQVTDRVRRK